MSVMSDRKSWGDSNHLEREQAKKNLASVLNSKREWLARYIKELKGIWTKRFGSKRSRPLYDP